MITAIEAQKRNPERVNVHLDGEFAFSLAGILAARLKVGQQLDPTQADALLADDERERVLQLALHYLSFRPRSEAEIGQYLRKHKIPAEIVEQTLSRLRESRLADDQQFARAWVDNRNAFRPRGRRALAWELNRKGLDPAASQAALADLDESALAYQAAARRAPRLAQLPWPEFRSKLTAFLARRGFPSSVITPVVSRLWKEGHGGQATPDNEEFP